MKVTFELPSPLVQRPRVGVPSAHRSGFVACLISKSLRGQGSVLQQAARKANGLLAFSYCLTRTAKAAYKLCVLN